MDLFPSLFHRSGGVVYHWRAFQNLARPWRSNLWLPHAEQTRAFIEEWNPQSNSLYLVGPSGGYSLPKNWLQKFSSITAFEPDWLARKIFEFRTGTRPVWITKPFRFDELKNGTLAIPEHSAILFSNLLGQLNFDEQAGLLAQEELLKLALTNEFASYHDILSGDHFRFEWSSPIISTEDGEQPLRVKYELEALDPFIAVNEEVVNKKTMEGLTELDLHVHPAAYLFQDPEPFRYQYWEWQITRKQTQVIEGVYSRR